MFFDSSTSEPPPGSKAAVMRKVSFFYPCKLQRGLWLREESALKLVTRKRSKYKLLIFGTMALVAQCVSSSNFTVLMLNISPLPVFCSTTLSPPILPSLFRLISPLVVQHVAFLLFLYL